MNRGAASIKIAPMRILLTTTSYQDTPGKHHDLLAASGLEVVRERGPIDEAGMLKLVKEGGGFDGLLNGDDAITARVIDAALPRLKVIAKYGIGLDSIDVKYATSKKIPVLFTPGVNHTTVAEQTFGLMIALAKHFYPQIRSVKEGKWKRVTGTELFGKKIAILGLGRIGREVAKRARAFEMNICSANHAKWDEAFAATYKIQRCVDNDEAMSGADIISLHMSLRDDNRGFLNKARLNQLKKGALLINTARGGLVVEQDVADACRSGQLGGYAADVLEQEPIKPPHPFQELDNIIVTPHIGSRTFESVERQALRATTNIVEYLKGGKDYIQANVL
jgi:D-3-phosphoglycerate dehydrogenase